MWTKTDRCLVRMKYLICTKCLKNGWISSMLGFFGISNSFIRLQRVIMFKMFGQQCNKVESALNCSAFSPYYITLREN